MKSIFFLYSECNFWYSGRHFLQIVKCHFIVISGACHLSETDWLYKLATSVGFLSVIYEVSSVITHLNEIFNIMLLTRKNQETEKDEPPSAFNLRQPSTSKLSFFTLINICSFSHWLLLHVHLSVILIQTQWIFV